MIITVVSDVLGEENNGTTIAAMNLIRFLKERGHTVRVLCCDQNRKGEEGYYVVPCRTLGKFLDKYVKKVGVTLSKPQEDIVRAALDGVEHVHSILPFALGKMALKVAQETGIPFTAGFHMQAQNFTSYFKMNNSRLINKAIYKYIYKGFYKDVDGIHYPTEFIKNVFERNVKKQTNGYVISNGVHAYVQRRECEKPEALKDKTVILSTGRYAREKSQDVLIKAVAKSKYKNSIRLILAGLGLKEKKYKKLAKKLGVDAEFAFYSRTEIIDVLNYADLYVHPAEFELEGISCLEAVACGKLTIVSDSKQSATKEFAVDEKCIFKNRNVKSLTALIEYWIENPTERKEYEEKYLRSAITYAQDECMRRMEEMIFEVGEKKKLENKQ